MFLDPGVVVSGVELLVDRADGDGRRLPTARPPTAGGPRGRRQGHVVVVTFGELGLQVGREFLSKEVFVYYFKKNYIWAIVLVFHRKSG